MKVSVRTGFFTVYFAFQLASSSRRLAFCSKNSAWLNTADTVEGWNDLAIRNAGSGRLPVKNRSGYGRIHVRRVRVCD